MLKNQELSAILETQAQNGQLTYENAVLKIELDKTVNDCLNGVNALRDRQSKFLSGLDERVNRLSESGKIFADNSNLALGNFTKNLDTALNAALADYFERTNAAIREQKAALEANTERQRKFFAFDGVRVWAFWAGVISNAFVLALLIIFIAGK